MLTKEELYLLRNFLGLTVQDVGNLMLCTKQTISNIELGRSTQKMTILFYEKTLMEVLANKEEGPTTYELYIEEMIARYAAMLFRYKLGLEYSGDPALQVYIDNDLRVSYEAFSKTVNTIQKQIREE